MATKFYTKYLNYGYFLSKFEPSFLKKLLKTTDNLAEINEPLKLGKSQHNKEKVFDKLKTISLPSIKGKDKGKRIDPEI